MMTYSDACVIRTYHFSSSMCVCVCVYVGAHRIVTGGDGRGRDKSNLLLPKTAVSHVRGVSVC